MVDAVGWFLAGFIAVAPLVYSLDNSKTLLKETKELFDHLKAYF